MILNGRLTTENPQNPVKLNFLDYEEQLEEASELLEASFQEGYASSDEEVAETAVPTRSPLYSVELLMPENSVGERVFPEEAYMERPLEDRSRMHGVFTHADEVVEALEDGYIYLMGVAHASDSEVSPEFRLVEKPLPTIIENSEEAMENLEAVERAVEKSMGGIGFYDYALWTDSFSDPFDAVKEAFDSELKFAASVYTGTPFHVDVGFLKSPQETESSFGIEIRNRASQAVTRNGLNDVRNAVDEVVENLEDEGFNFPDKRLELEM